MTVIDIIDGINKLILSDKITGSQTEILKEARKILEGMVSEEVSQTVTEEIQEDESEKQRETSSRGKYDRSSINPYKKKSSGKPGKRCVHCGHFNKYDKVAIKNTHCLGRCTLFDIQVRDNFNGCSQEGGKVILHNFDDEEFEKAVKYFMEGKYD